jgi:hypothetical protein
LAIPVSFHVRFLCVSGQGTNSNINAPGVMRDAPRTQAHFNSGQHSEYCRIVKVTEMTDAEDAIAEAAEAVSQ